MSQVYRKLGRYRNTPTNKKTRRSGSCGLSVVGELTVELFAFGSALSTEQQLFVSEHWRELHTWLGTDAGRDAARLVVEEWRSARPGS